MPRTEAAEDQREADPVSWRPRSFATLRRATLTVTFFTGFTGLVYEVTWHKYLCNLLGSQARAAALILAVFLAGLSLGYLLFGKISRQRSPRRLLELCGQIELGIGAWCMLFPWFYRLAWSQTEVLQPSGAIAILEDILVSVLLMGVPTVLMGGTLPLLTQGLSRDLEDAGPLHAKVYAVNTAGAFLGTLLSGLLIIPFLGLPATMRWAAVINLLAGAIILWLARSLSAEPPRSLEVLPAPTSSPERRSMAAAYAVALFAGFYAISLQVVLMRIVGLSMGSSEYAFPMIVAAFILMLALGASRLASDRSWKLPLWCNQLIACAGTLALYYTIEDWPYWCHVLRSLFTTVSPNFYVYHLAAFFVLCLVLAVPVGAMGGTMPLLFTNVASRFTDLGHYVGRLYAINTIGCVAGALIGGYWLMYYMNLDNVFRICVGAMLLTVLLSAPLKSWTGAQRLSGLIVVLMLATLLLRTERWDVMRLNSGLFRQRGATDRTFAGADSFFENYWRYRVVAYWDDPNSSVYVTERDALDHEKRVNGGVSYVRNIRVNGKSDGETANVDMATMRLAAHLPMLFSESTVEDAAVIGFGLGVTVGTLTLYPEVKEVLAIEISPAVREFAHFFDYANHGVTKSSKVTWAVGDAYRVLGGSERKFSLIVSEPSNPWVTGVERLFSREFYEVVRSRLRPGGIYVQWFHTYEISEDTMAMVFNTFSSSFKNVRLFANRSDLIMLGTDAPIAEDALRHLATRYDNLPEVRKSLTELDLANVESIIALEQWLPLRAFAAYDLHSLERPKLAYAAGHDFFMVEDTKIDTLTRRTELEPWIRHASRDALIAKWASIGGRKLEVLERYFRAVCEQQEVAFFRGWTDTRPECRAILSALAIVGRIKPGEIGPGEPELDILQHLAESPWEEEMPKYWEDLGKRTRPEETIALIRLFSTYDSSLVPLSIRKLLVASASCGNSVDQDAIRCRTHLTDAMARQGYGTLAKAMHADLLKLPGFDTTSATAGTLAALVDEAVLAEREFVTRRKAAAAEQPAAQAEPRTN